MDDSNKVIWFCLACGGDVILFIDSCEQLFDGINQKTAKLFSIFNERRAVQHQKYNNSSKSPVCVKKSNVTSSDRSRNCMFCGNNKTNNLYTHVFVFMPEMCVKIEDNKCFGNQTIILSPWTLYPCGCSVKLIHSQFLNHTNDCPFVN